MIGGLISVRPFMVTFAVRAEFETPSENESIVAQDVIRVASQLSHTEAQFILRSIDMPAHFTRADLNLWETVADALNWSPRDATDQVSVTGHLILSAVRYAIGRQTYAPAMVAEELRRVAAELDDDSRLRLADLLEGRIVTADQTRPGVADEVSHWLIVQTAVARDTASVAR